MSDTDETSGQEASKPASTGTQAALTVANAGFAAGGSVIGTLLGGPLGAITGSAAGSAIGSLATDLFKWLSDQRKEKAVKFASDLERLVGPLNAAVTNSDGSLNESKAALLEDGLSAAIEEHLDQKRDAYLRICKAGLTGEEIEAESSRLVLKTLRALGAIELSLLLATLPKYHRSAEWMKGAFSRTEADVRDIAIGQLRAFGLVRGAAGSEQEYHEVWVPAVSDAGLMLLKHAGFD